MIGKHDKDEHCSNNFKSDIIHLLSRLSKRKCGLVIVWVYICGVMKCFFGRGVSSTASHDQVKSEGAFTPDTNEAFRANYLHVKSMQRRDRQSRGANYAREFSVWGV